jgi:Tfp pilus assembly protein PilN
MDRVDLDFVAHRHRPGFFAWALLLVGASMLALVVVWQQLDREPKIAARKAQLSTLQTAIEARRPPAARFDDKQLAAEWTRAISVAGELNQPWDKLFAMLEKDVKRPVAVLTLEPDAAKHEMMMTAEAKNFDEMLAYYRYLQQQQMLTSVVLHTHQVNQQDKERPINFRITANWLVKP